VDGEEVIVRVEGALGAVQGEPAAGRLAGGRVDGHKDAVIGDGLDAIEFSHAQGQQVGGHDGRGLEGDCLAAGRDRFHCRLWHVGQNGQGRIGGDLHGKDGLGSRLVDAGEAPARIQTLKLRAGHDFRLAVHAGVAAPVETSHLVVEEAAVQDLQLDLFRAIADGSPEHKLHRGCFDIEDDFFGSDSRSTVVFDHRVLGAAEAELLGVQRDGFAIAVVQFGTVHAKGDGAFPRKGERHQIGRQVQIVPGEDENGGRYMQEQYAMNRRRTDEPHRFVAESKRIISATGGGGLKKPKSKQQKRFLNRQSHAPFGKHMAWQQDAPRLFVLLAHHHGRSHRILA
jgi:hypothetical protein